MAVVSCNRHTCGIEWIRKMLKLMKNADKCCTVLCLEAIIGTCIKCGIVLPCQLKLQSSGLDTTFSLNHVSSDDFKQISLTDQLVRIVCEFIRSARENIEILTFALQVLRLLLPDEKYLHIYVNERVAQCTPDANEAVSTHEKLSVLLLTAKAISNSAQTDFTLLSNANWPELNASQLLGSEYMEHLYRVLVSLRSELFDGRSNGGALGVEKQLMFEKPARLGRSGGSWTGPPAAGHPYVVAADTVGPERWSTVLIENQILFEAVGVICRLETHIDDRARAATDVATPIKGVLKVASLGRSLDSADFPLLAAKAAARSVELRFWMRAMNDCTETLGQRLTTALLRCMDDLNLCAKFNPGETPPSAQSFVNAQPQRLMLFPTAAIKQRFADAVKHCDQMVWCISTATFPVKFEWQTLRDALQTLLARALLWIVDTFTNRVPAMKQPRLASLEHAVSVLDELVFVVDLLERQCAMKTPQYVEPDVLKQLCADVTAAVVVHNEQLLAAYVLLDGKAYDWTCAKPFCENERCSYSVQLWWRHMARLQSCLERADVAQSNGRLVEGIYRRAVLSSLELLCGVYLTARPSYRRLPLFRSDVLAVLLCASQLLLRISPSVDALLLQAAPAACLPAFSAKPLDDALDQHTDDDIRRLHAYCRALFAALCVVASPIDSVQRHFAKGFDHFRRAATRKQPTGAAVGWLCCLEGAIFAKLTDRSVYSVDEWVWLQLCLLDERRLLAERASLVVELLFDRRCTVAVLLCRRCYELTAARHDSFAADAADSFDTASLSDSPSTVDCSSSSAVYAPHSTSDSPLAISPKHLVHCILQLAIAVDELYADSLVAIFAPLIAQTDLTDRPLQALLRPIRQCIEQTVRPCVDAAIGRLADEVEKMDFMREERKELQQLECGCSTLLAEWRECSKDESFLSALQRCVEDIWQVLPAALPACVQRLCGFVDERGVPSPPSQPPEAPPTAPLLFDSFLVQTLCDVLREFAHRPAHHLYASSLTVRRVARQFLTALMQILSSAGLKGKVRLAKQFLRKHRHWLRELLNDRLQLLVANRNEQPYEEAALKRQKLCEIGDNVLCSDEGRRSMHTVSRWVEANTATLLSWMNVGPAWWLRGGGAEGESGAAGGGAREATFTLAGGAARPPDDWVVPCGLQLGHLGRLSFADLAAWRFDWPLYLLSLAQLERDEFVALLRNRFELQPGADLVHAERAAVAALERAYF